MASKRIFPSGIVSVFVIVLTSTLAMTALSNAANVSAPVVQETLRFASMVPGSLGTPSSMVFPVRLRIPQAMAIRGYRIAASGSFVFHPSVSSSQGRSIAASDFIIGVGAVTDPAGASPNVTINPGFEKDPLTAFGRFNNGQPAGFKTVADLQRGVDLLRIDKLPATAVPQAGREIGLTVRIAVRPQYFTPGQYSGTIYLMALD